MLSSWSTFDHLNLGVAPLIDSITEKSSGSIVGKSHNNRLLKCYYCDKKT